MNDRIEELEKIFEEKIEEVKTYNYEQLLEFCKKENLDDEGLEEKELKEAIIKYLEEEIGD